MCTLVLSSALSQILLDRFRPDRGGVRSDTPFFMDRPGGVPSPQLFPKKRFPTIVASPRRHYQGGPTRLCHYQRGPTPVMPLPAWAHPAYATTSVGPPRLCHYQGQATLVTVPRLARWLNLDARAVPEALVRSPALPIAPRTRITGSGARIRMREDLLVVTRLFWPNSVISNP